MLHLILFLLSLTHEYRSDELQKFIESRHECLVLYYNEPNPNFLRIFQHFTSNGFPIKIYEVNSSNYEEMYDKYKVDYYPIIRYYLGHIDLYVDYLGDLTDSEEDIEEADDEADSLLLENASDFLDSRITNSYKVFDMEGQEKFKDAIMNDRFGVIYVGEEAEGCFKLFESLSKINDKDGFFKINFLAELTAVDPAIAAAINQREVKNELFAKDSINDDVDGLYLISNFEDKLNLKHLCSPRQSIPNTTHNIFEANKLLKDHRFPPLKSWNVRAASELIALKHKFILIFYEPFFDHSVVSETNKRFIMNLYDDAKEKIRKFNYYDGVVPVYHANNTCKECIAYFKSLIGQSHIDSFLYFFEIRSRGDEIKEMIKYRFVIESMYKVKFNIRGFLSSIRDEKIREFYRSEVIAKSESSGSIIVEKANSNMLIEKYKKKNKKTEVYLCYTDAKKINEFQNTFKDVKSRGVKLYTFNLEHNEIPVFIIKIQNTNNFILLKKKAKKMFKVISIDDKSLQDIKNEIFSKGTSEIMEEDL